VKPTDVNPGAALPGSGFGIASQKAVQDPIALLQDSKKSGADSLPGFCGGAVEVRVKGTICTSDQVSELNWGGATDAS